MDVLRVWLTRASVKGAPWVLCVRPLHNAFVLKTLRHSPRVVQYPRVQIQHASTCVRVLTCHEHNLETVIQTGSKFAHTYDVYIHARRLHLNRQCGSSIYAHVESLANEREASVRARKRRS